MPNWEQKALEACYGEVLDIGAGAGSHALHLQNIGLDVTAMDISPGAIEIMQSRGVENIVHGSIWDFTNRKFDTLLLLMNGNWTGRRSQRTQSVFRTRQIPAQAQWADSV